MQRRDLARWWEHVYGNVVELSAARGVGADVEQRLMRAARAIHELAPDEPLDLERLARRACYSRYHFLREFKRVYGETPHRYLVRARLERARTLLESTDRPITEICLDVGYSSVGSFSALFSRYHGRSPLHYRRRFVQVAGDIGLAPSARIPACFLHNFVGAWAVRNFREAAEQPSR